jgi:FRG domain
VPNELKVHKVESLRQYMELIEEAMEPHEALWFRGSALASYSLVPTLYRHPGHLDVDEILGLEEEVIQRFRERGAPYERVPSSDTWEILFLMQHFGVPTRLLDWTENPYIGLFFALTSLRPNTDEPAAVWILQPAAWNQAALADISYDGAILSIGNDALDSYRPSAKPQFMKVVPVGLYGIHNSPRIVAQRGVFTIFGKATTPMEETFYHGDFQSEALMKVEIPAATIPQLRESLFAIGITDSVVYPDLSGLAMELKRYFGFEV